MKRFLGSMVYVFIIVMSFFSVSSMTSSNLVPTNEVLTQVSSHEEAIALGKQYHLDLLEVSNYGIARYQISSSKQLPTLLANGFSLNQTSSVFRPPFQSTVDPYLKDQYAIPLMQTDRAWTLTTGSNQVIVAIIDTGIDTAHPEFTNRIHALSYNSRTKEVGISKVVDDFGHGTMVAGIVGAIKDNSRGIAGIAPNSMLLIIKANNEALGTFPDSAIIEGIYYAVENGANIINLSLGGSYANPQTKIAVDYAKSRGVFVVSATGNDGEEGLKYPAGFDSVISVGAIDKTKTIASYSNFGVGLDVVAPGSEIITTTRNSGYGSASGTSFASPQVAGLLALLLSYDATLSYDEVVARLTKTAMEAGTVGYDKYYGNGIANTYLSLTTDFHQVVLRDNGTVIDSFYTMKLQPIGLLPEPIKVDHVFEGWFTDASFMNPWNETTDLVTSDMTLYAKFNAAFHTVRYYDGTVLLGSEVVPHGEFPTFPAFSFEGRKFLNWMKDAELTQPYLQTAILNDTSFYALTRAFYTYLIEYRIHGELYATTFYVEETTLELLEVDVVGKIFSGWYLDESFLTLFEGTSVHEAIVLYGKLEDIVLTITLVQANDILSIELPYGSILTYEAPEENGNAFVSWYFDEAYTLRYDKQELVKNQTLYAKYASNTVTITYQVDGVVVGLFHYEVDKVQLLNYTKDGHQFFGWFIDEAYTIAADANLEHATYTLYGYTVIKQFKVQYLGLDGSLIQEVLVHWHTLYQPDVIPDTPTSDWLTFTFLGWGVREVLIEQDLTLTPVYEVTFDSTHLRLYPGLDTIQQYQEWIDGGINVVDPWIRVLVNSPVNPAIAGRYVVEYQIMHQNQVLYTMKRYVRVEAKPNVITITLNPGVATILKGMEYVEAGATAHGYDVEIIGTVNSMVPGMYPIIYQVTTEDLIIRRTRFVHVVDFNQSTTLSAPFMIRLKEEDFYA